MVFLLQKDIRQHKRTVTGLELGGPGRPPIEQQTQEAWTPCFAAGG